MYSALLEAQLASSRLAAARFRRLRPGHGSITLSENILTATHSSHLPMIRCCARSDSHFGLLQSMRKECERNAKGICCAIPAPGYCGYLPRLISFRKILLGGPQPAPRIPGTGSARPYHAVRLWVAYGAESRSNCRPAWRRLFDFVSQNTCRWTPACSWPASARVPRLCNVCSLRSGISLELPPSVAPAV